MKRKYNEYHNSDVMKKWISIVYSYNKGIISLLTKLAEA